MIESQALPAGKLRAETVADVQRCIVARRPGPRIAPVAQGPHFSGGLQRVSK